MSRPPPPGGLVDQEGWLPPEYAAPASFPRGVEHAEDTDEEFMGVALGGCAIATLMLDSSVLDLFLCWWAEGLK